jgi:hypothetical protein
VCMCLGVGNCVYIYNVFPSLGSLCSTPVTIFDIYTFLTIFDAPI